MPKRLAWLLILVLLLSACGPATTEVTPTATKTPTTEAAAQATVPPTDTPAPPADTATPVPTTSGADTTPLVPSPTPTQTAATEAPTDAAAPTNTPKPAAPPVPTGMMSPDFGAQAFLWWRSEVADRDLTLMSNGGFRWVKQWFAWNDIEGAGKGQYDWSIPDRIVQQAEDKGLKLLVRMDREPGWAGPPPQNTDDYVDFLSAAATRYKGRIAAYQIWNEPNLAREWGNKPPNPAEYTAMLKASYDAIKAADPNALVLTAGMAPTTETSERAMFDLDFYRGMYEAMGSGGSTGYFDMLGVHGAGFKAPPEKDPGEVANDPAFYNVGDPYCPGERCRVYSFRHIEDVRQIMVDNGDANKKVVVLEFGWTSDSRPDSPYYWHAGGAGIDEAVKGDYMRRSYEFAKANWQPWIGLMSAIYMPDLDWTPEDEQYWWSIIDPSPIDQFHPRAAFIELCLYFNEQLGRPRCEYAFY